MHYGPCLLVSCLSCSQPTHFDIASYLPKCYYLPESHVVEGLGIGAWVIGSGWCTGLDLYILISYCDCILQSILFSGLGLVLIVLNL